MCFSLYLTSTAGTRKRNEQTDIVMWAETEGMWGWGGGSVSGDILTKSLSYINVTISNH